jgi:chemosensory pili system protein ChpC
MAKARQISSLFIPVSGKNLLLPNASVAEIIDYVPPSPTRGTPDWMLGYVEWRGIQLPVLSYDIANGDSTSNLSSRARLAVINAVGENHKDHPFFAIVTQGIPRLIKVQEEEITEDEQPVGQADTLNVKISGESAAIPNIDYLEDLLRQALR